MNKKNIDRRNFIRQAGLGSLAIGIPISTIKNVPGTYIDVLVEKNIAKGNGASNRPNILYLHSHDTGRYIQPLPDVPEMRQDMADFMESASILDEKMGTVLTSLRRNGLEDNTLVICTTDYGIAFPTMKCNLYDEGTGIFMIIRGPGGFSGGKTINSMVSVIDIFPTICELLEIEKPVWLDGTSVMPLIREENKEIREDIFSQVNYHAAYEPMRSIRTKRYKYIRRFGDKKTRCFPTAMMALASNTGLTMGGKM